jgi:alpha-tubulin suppressor-like RCC1 family protein
MVRPTIFARPVFNLKLKGKIRFYTWGNEFVEIRTENGEVYRLGTQKSGELTQILRKAIESQ